MVEDLIRLCLPGDWIEHLDFSSLEQVSERFIEAEGDMKRREADLIWRLRYNLEALADRLVDTSDNWFYVYLNLEHMSNPRTFMAVFTESYRLGTWQQMIRHDPEQLPEGKLPPVLSVVFYNGDKEWKPKMLPELVQTIPNAPPGLALGTFVLVDAQRWQVTNVSSPLEALFKLEQVDSIEDVKVATRDTRRAVGTNQELSEAFVALLNNVVFQKLVADDEKPLKISNLEETSMLEQRIERIAQGLILQGRSEGLQIGRTEGIQQGRTEGIVVGAQQAKESLFLKLFAAKFGDMSATIQDKAADASSDELDIWAERLLTAERPEDVFSG